MSCLRQAIMALPISDSFSFMNGARWLLDAAALAAFIYLSVSVYRLILDRERALPPMRLFAMVTGAQAAIYFALLAAIPELIDEGEIAGTLLLTLYLAPLFWRIRKDEDQLIREKDMAEVTLASIGDGVITTDLRGRVETLNPAAERITGWSLETARGREIEEIFRIVDKETRAVIASPVRRAIESGEQAGLAKQTLLVSRDGAEIAVEDSASPIRDARGDLRGCVLIFRDVGHQREMLQKITWQANHDTLTGLPNRALLGDRVERALARAQRNRQLVLVAFIDLDGFKPVNDRYGHEAGDALLVEVARRLKGCMRADDTVARLGGDEFVLVLSSLAAYDEIDPTITRILAEISAPYLIGGVSVEISASIGATAYPLDPGDADTLIRHADQAMYQVKQEGRRHFRLFDSRMDHQLRERQAQIERIQQAILRGELVLYYQPKVYIPSGAVVGMEALLRWQHPERGVLAPAEFLPMVAQTPTMLDIDRWVLSAALAQVAAWRSNGLDINVSVNLSERMLQHTEFPEYLRELLHRHAQPGRALELEVLESAALHDLETVVGIVKACRQLGVTIALDDFGTGYSALSYLKQLPADTVKIDRQFVRDMLHDHEDAAIVEAIIGLSGTFRKTVVAEGVETAAHAESLLGMGCFLAQGYGIARPMPAGQVMAWVSGRSHAATVS